MSAESVKQKCYSAVPGRGGCTRDSSAWPEGLPRTKNPPGQRAVEFPGTDTTTSLGDMKTPLSSGSAQAQGNRGLQEGTL